MLDFVLCVGSNLFRVYLIYKFIQIFVCETKQSKIKEIVPYIVFCFVNTTLFLIFHLVWVNILCNLIGISILVRLYTKSWKTNLFVTTSIYIINMGCDIFATLMFVNYEDGNPYSQIYATIGVFLIFVCELLIKKIVGGRKNGNNMYNVSLIWVPICSIILLHILMRTNSCTHKGIAIISCGLLSINFLMFYFYSLLLKSFEQKYEAEALRKMVQIYANQLDVILQSEGKIKALRHDMKHHMNELKLMAVRYENKDIQDYIEDMESFIQNPNEIVSSGNVEIDSVLNYILQKAKENLITVKVKVQIPEKLQHSFDINVLVGNLLENAIEAAVKTEEKYLNVEMREKKGVLTIKIENSFIPKLLVKKETGKADFFTTKDSTDHHGIGLQNVKKIIEKYNGIMDVETQGTIFCVKLLLYMMKIGNE